MTRVSFSDNTLNFALPQSWADLSQEELATVYDALQICKDGDPRHHMLMLLCHMSILKNHRSGDDRFRIAVKLDGGRVVVAFITAEELACMAEELNWIAEPGSVPVRLDSIDVVKALDAKFHGVQFGTYLKIENLYQGYISSKNPLALCRVESMLYPGLSPSVYLDEARTLNVLNWMVQLKKLFSNSFKNFFKPVGDSSSGEEPTMLEIMNNQIRILTGGDITKEQQILESDCWRALTELDFKAKEAEELRKLQSKHK